MNLDCFYVLPENVSENIFTVKDLEAKHLSRVLRKDVGDHILATDGLGKTYEGKIRLISNSIAECDIITRYENRNEPKVRMTLGVGIIKSSLLEDALNSCIQIGISRFIPLETDRSVKKKVKYDRLNKIAMTAMKQSQRCRLTKIEHSQDISEFIATTKDCSVKYIGVMDEQSIHIGKALSEEDVSSTKNLALLIGPEGDFTDEEMEQALNSGFKPVSLGSRRLRTETATVTATAVILSHFGIQDIGATA